MKMANGLVVILAVALAISVAEATGRKADWEVSNKFKSRVDREKTDSLRSDVVIKAKVPKGKFARATGDAKAEAKKDPYLNQYVDTSVITNTDNHKHTAHSDSTASIIADKSYPHKKSEIVLGVTGSSTNNAKGKTTDAQGFTHVGADDKKLFSKSAGQSTSITQKKHHY